ncbi:hypothetical protein [Anaerosolibacter sp.]|uniref:hypothetical protein n=1 Tax=Anaerosolibacter sp. TaxID=1872527 RepID=UPI0039F072DA
MKNSLAAAVNELAKWDKLMADGRKEMNKHKLIIQNEATKDLENSKIKQVKYWGDEQNCAVATMAEKVELISQAYLKQIIPEDILKDFLKEEVQFKLTDAFKKIVAPLANGNYTEQTIADVIKQMNLEPHLEKVAKKKLKGRFEKDLEFLRSIGFEEKDAEHWAYFASEAAAWERIVKLLNVSGYKEGTVEFNEALEGIKQAVIVEESLKIGVEYEGID